MFETRPDRLHRYGYLVFAGLCLAGTLLALVQHRPALNVLILFGGALLSGFVGWGRLLQRPTV